MSVMVSNLRSNEVDNFSRISGKFGTCSPELPEAERRNNKLFQAVKRAFVRGLLQKFNA